ncbi:hypothetical protein E2320_000128 [Naja naja]|nr:hypothetical protein E2320_000128 [Naja naja]
MQSSDFEKKLIFMFPRLEIIANLLHFQVRAFRVELAQGISQKVGSYPKANLKMLSKIEFSQKTEVWTQSSDFEKHFIFFFSRELPQGISQKVGLKSIKQENITFDSDFGFQKEVYFHFPQGGNHCKSISFSDPSFPCGVIPSHISKCWVELNSARNHNLSQTARISEINSFSCSPGWKTLKIHFISGSQLSLRSYRKAYFKTLVENVENPHHFRSRVFPEELSQGKSQNVVWNSIQEENITFHSDLRFRKEAYFHLTQESSDFENKLIFMLPRIENFENSHHFQSRVFPEELSQGKSQNVVWNSIQAENITFDSELGFRKEAYFHVPQVGNHCKSTSFSDLSFPCGVIPSDISKCWVELNSTRNHNF